MTSVNRNPQVLNNQPGPGGAVFWSIRFSRLRHPDEAKESARLRETFRALMKEWLDRRSEGTSTTATKLSS